MNSEFYESLRCPKTQQTLSLIGSKELEELNTAISSGELLFMDGRSVSQPLDGGLMREDKALLFPIHKELASLLMSEAISAALIAPDTSSSGD